LTKWEGLNRRVIFLRSMAYKNPLPFIGLYVQERENASLEKTAKQHKITRTQLARACMRAGLQLFEENPEKVLALARVGEC